MSQVSITLSLVLKRPSTCACLWGTIPGFHCLQSVTDPHYPQDLMGVFGSFVKLSVSNLQYFFG